MAFDNKIIRIALRKIKFIDQAEADLLDGLEPIEQKMFQAIKKQLSKMNQEGGSLSFDENNINLINQVDDLLIQEIQKSGYPGSVRKYLRDFDTLTDFNGELHEQLNGIDPEELKKIVGPGQEQIVEDTLQGLTGSGVSTEVVAPIRQELFKNVVAGSSFEDVEQALREFITGSEGKNGQLSKYVTQISRDALNQYDGQVNSQIAKEFDLNAYEYVGSLIDDSRPQCRRWVNKEVLLKADLPSEIAWAESNGSGMIPGTTPDNFAIYRGGYNCRHQAIPFKLTRREAERLKKRQAKEPTEEDDVNADIASIEQSVEVSKKTTPIKDESTGTELNDQQFRSTRKKEINEAFLESLSNSDGFNEIANEYQTNVSLRTQAESSSSGTRTFIQNAGKGGSSLDIGTMGREQGHVSLSNKRFNVKIGSKDIIEHRKVEINGNNPFSIKGDDLEELIKDNELYFVRTNPNGTKTVYKRKTKTSSSGYSQATIDQDGNVKFWSVTEADNFNQKKNNINATIIHESGHLIQNKYDPKTVFGTSQSGNNRDKMRALMQKHGLTLDDAPTKYGETNHSEFFTETYTSYLLNPEGLKEARPDLHQFIEELLFDEYGIDKTTLKFAK